MLRRIFSGILVSLLLVGMFTLAFRIEPVKAQPTTIIVPDDYPTIQDAIDGASGGDTVFVRNGTYYEHVTIHKSITLVGEDRNATIIDGNGTGTVIDIGFDNVRILNFTIRNSGPFSLHNPTAFNALIDSGFYADLDIENNTLMNAGAAAISVGGSNSIYISNNFVSNSTWMGIDVGNPNLSETYNITVSNNTVREVSEGINFDGDTENSTIENNSVEDCGLGIGLAPNGGTNIVPSNDLFEGNLLSNNSNANLMILGVLPQSSYMNTFRSNNLTNTLAPNIIVWAPYPGFFNQDVDSSNTANGKPIYYITNQSNLDVDPSNYPDAGYLALVNCNNVTAQEFDLSANIDGMLMAEVNNCTLTNMTLGNNHPYYIMPATNQSIPYYWGGLTLFESSNNTITDSTIYNDTVGVSFYKSDINLFFHNSFINNSINVLSNFTYPIEFGIFYGLTVPVSTNLWDNGYPSGGNYWSNYNGTDVKSGPYQNETGSDWVGDSLYVIDANNTDMYPLMTPFSSETGQVEVDYRSLLMGFTALQSNLTSLSSTVLGLQQQLTTLQQSISSLGLNLQGQINSLNQTTTSLGQSLINLETQISSVNSTLQALINGLQEQNNRLSDQMGIILNVLYVLVALTIIAVISAIYLAVKRLNQETNRPRTNQSPDKLTEPKDN